MPLFPISNRTRFDAASKMELQLGVFCTFAGIVVPDASVADRRPVTSEVAGSSPVVPAIPFNHLESFPCGFLRRF